MPPKVSRTIPPTGPKMPKNEIRKASIKVHPCLFRGYISSSLSCLTTHVIYPFWQHSDRWYLQQNPTSLCAYIVSRAHLKSGSQRGPANHLLVGGPFLSLFPIVFLVFLKHSPTICWLEAFWKWSGEALPNHPTTLRWALQVVSKMDAKMHSSRCKYIGIKTR